MMKNIVHNHKEIIPTFEAVDPTQATLYLCLI